MDEKLKGIEIGKYDAEVLKPRNFLAHGVPRSDGAKGYIFAHHGKEYQFNEDIGKELRTKIMAYKVAFKSMLQSLSET